MGWGAMGCDGVRWDVMRWDAMGCDGVRWDAMVCDGVRWGAMGCDGMRCDAMGCDGGCDAMRWDAMGGAMGCDGMRWDAIPFTILDFLANLIGFVSGGARFAKKTIFSKNPKSKILLDFSLFLLKKLKSSARRRRADFLMGFWTKICFVS
jgi:pentapeptide MXKDX repeat protein